MALGITIPTEKGVVQPGDVERWLQTTSQKLGGIPVSRTNSPCPVIQEGMHLVVSWKPRQRADQVTPFCHHHHCPPSLIIAELERLLEAHA